MGTVRPFREEDIPGVAELHRRVFHVAPSVGPELAAGYRRYFTQVFLGASEGDEGVHSLVHEGERGEITGFLGAVPRRFTMDWGRVVAAVSSQFVVDPKSRSQLVGVKLLKAFLTGPQALSIADEANATTRALWEALGGTTALLYSMHWTRALRPCQLALSFLRGRPRLAPLALTASPVAAVMDALSTRLPQSHFHQSPPPRLRGEGVTLEAYLDHLPRFTGGFALRPECGDRALVRVGQRAMNEETRRVLLRDDRGEPRGAYLYRPEAGGMGQVIQIAADPGALGDVLQHLFHDAWRRGALALSGRLEPRLLQALSDRYALFHRRGPWTLIHAREPEIVAAFERGKAFFSRLEGELCLRFEEDSAATPRATVAVCAPAEAVRVEPRC